MAQAAVSQSALHSSMSTRSTVSRIAMVESTIVSSQATATKKRETAEFTSYSSTANPKSIRDTTRGQQCYHQDLLVK
jgi:hypothetical protein